MSHLYIHSITFSVHCVVTSDCYTAKFLSLKIILHWINSDFQHSQTVTTDVCQCGGLISPLNGGDWDIGYTTDDGRLTDCESTIQTIYGDTWMRRLPWFTDTLSNIKLTKSQLADLRSFETMQLYVPGIPPGADCLTVRVLLYVE